MEHLRGSFLRRGIDPSFPLAASLLAGLVLAIYAPALGGPFLFDDIEGIVDNFALRSLVPPWAAANSPPDSTPFGRPIVAFSLALNRQIGGLHPAGFRVFNLLLHWMVACVVFSLARRLWVAARPGRAGDAGAISLAVAALWVAHPLCTSAVTYIVQRAEVLMALCYGLVLLGTTFVCSGDGRQRSIWAWGAPVACAAGMLCKESMVTAPVAALLLDRCFYSKSFRAILSARRSFHASLAASWLLLAMVMAIWPRSRSVGFHEATLSWWDYLLMQVEVICHYLRLAIWPVGLSLDYWWARVGSAGQILPELALLGFLGVVILRAWRRSLPLGFLATMPFIILAPTSSVVPVLTAVASEHRMYLPLAFLISLAVLGADVVFQKSRSASLVAKPMALVAVTCLGVLSLLRNLDYLSDVTIWSKAAAQQPRNPRALNNLGAALLRREEYTNAEEALRRALDIKPDYPQALFNLGSLLARSDRVEEGRALLERAIKTEPGFADAHLNLGNIALLEGNASAAARSFETALRHDPHHRQAAINLIILDFNEGRTDHALLRLNALLADRPDDTELVQLRAELQRQRQAP